MKRLVPGLAIAASFFASTAGATVITIGPFSGAVNETWESFPNYGTPSPITYLADPSAIMGGAAEISNPFLTVYEPSALWTFGLGTSGSAQVADGQKGMGIDEDDQTTTITFATPVTRFGGYWGAATFSDFVPALVQFQFFDEFGAPIGSDSFSYLRDSSDGLLEWHGWQSTIPIGSLTYTGDFVVNDGLQADPIPEPASLVMLGTGLTALAFRRRRRN